MIAHTQADPAALQAMVDRLIRDGFLTTLEEGARVEGTQVEPTFRTLKCHTQVLTLQAFESKGSKPW